MGIDPTQSGWRVSGRSDGANTCVEARAEGEYVSVRNSTDPTGPWLTVDVSDWLDFLDHVAAGSADFQTLGAPVCLASFVVQRTTGGDVLLSITAEVDQSGVRYTKAEWDVFVAGVTLDGEFTVGWLLSPLPAPLNSH